MKKIKINETKALLESLHADETTIDLILNNIRHYNQNITKLAASLPVNEYLTYQLNVAISKQIEACKKNKPDVTTKEDVDNQKELENRLKKPNAN